VLLVINNIEPFDDYAYMVDTLKDYSDQVVKLDENFSIDDLISNSSVIARGLFVKNMVKCKEPLSKSEIARENTCC